MKIRQLLFYIIIEYLLYKFEMYIINFNTYVSDLKIYLKSISKPKEKSILIKGYPTT